MNIFVQGLRLAGQRSSWRSTFIDITQYVILFGALIWLLVQGANTMGYNWQWYRVPRYIYRVIDGELIWGPLVKGAIATLEIAALSLVIATVIGMATALLRLSDLIVGQAIAGIYLETIRNTPILVQLVSVLLRLRANSGAGSLLGWRVVFRRCLKVLLLRRSFALASYRWREVNGRPAPVLVYRRLRLIGTLFMPQAIRLMLPPLASLAITLIKHSAIVSVIAVSELTTAGRNIISDTFMSFEIWFTVAAIYLLITISLSLFVTYLEHRFKVKE